MVEVSSIGWNGSDGDAKAASGNPFIPMNKSFLGLWLCSQKHTTLQLSSPT
jgi:hypothetical protein